MTTIVADSEGVVSGKFKIPAGIPAGNKKISLVGEGGSYGEVIYSGQGQLQRDEYQQQVTITETRWQSPPPPPLIIDPAPAPPVIPPSEVWTVTPSSRQVNEGVTVTFAISASNVVGTGPFKYTITGISPADLSAGTLTGFVTLVNGVATPAPSITIAADSLTEGVETLNFAIGNTSASVTINDTSTSGVLVATYSVTASSTNINEGQSVSFTVNTTNVLDGVILPFAVTGIVASDVSGGGSALSGSVTITGNKSNAVTFNLLNDDLVDGSKVMVFSLTGHNASASVTVNDINTQLPQPTYVVSVDNAEINEGQAVTFSVKATNVAAGTSLPYTITGVADTDIEGGAAKLSGSFTVNASGTDSVAITLRNDLTTDGKKTITLNLTGHGASASAVVNDTSTTPIPTYSVSVSKSNYGAGETLKFAIRTTNVASGTQLPYQITGIYNNGDVAIPQNSTTQIFHDQYTDITAQVTFNTTGYDKVTFTLAGTNATVSAQRTYYSVLSLEAVKPNAGSAVTFRVSANVPDGTTVNMAYAITGSTTVNFANFLNTATPISQTIVNGSTNVVIQTASKTHNVYLFVLSDSIGSPASCFSSIQTNQLVHDPLAQTFLLDNGTQITGVDLWFTALGDTDVYVDIRGVEAGVPNKKSYARASKKVSQITTGVPTRFLFDKPARLEADIEYAIVVLCNDEVSALSLAELTKFDANNQKWVTSQPYTVGVLLSSSNASSWTAHQDKDMAFRLLKASFTETERMINLGTVAVTDSTDLLLMSYAEKPSATTRCDYTLTLPSGDIVKVSDGQAVRLPEAITGDVTVKAYLEGTESESPLLTAGTQLAAGKVATTADYISRAIPSSTGSRVRVIYDGYVPGGSEVEVFLQGIDEGDTWLLMPITESSNLGDDWREFSHDLLAVSESMVRVKMTLTGTSLIRPRIKDLRVVVL
jgi:hypothetical protein